MKVYNKCDEPVWIWVRKKALNTGQNGGDIISRTPSILEYVKTEFPIRIDVWVEHS